MSITSALSAGQALGLGYTQAGLGLVSPFVQGAFGLIGQNQAYKQNKHLMWLQGVYNNILNGLQWEREMQASNTAYRRAVKDLKGAGLNPILAVNGMSGASTPNIGAPSVSGHSAISAGSISPLIFDVLGALDTASRVTANSALAEKYNQERLESASRTLNSNAFRDYEYSPEVIKLKKDVLRNQGTSHWGQAYGDAKKGMEKIIDNFVVSPFEKIMRLNSNSAQSLKNKSEKVRNSNNVFQKRMNEANFIMGYPMYY